MRTINQVLDGLEAIALDHYFIRSFKQGEMSEVDIKKLQANDYPLCFADINAASIERGTMTYSIDILVAELILPGQTNAQEVYSNTLQTLNDIVSQYAQVLSAESDVNSDLTISLPVACDPFTARFDNLLSGWIGSFEIVTSNKLDLCAAAFA